MVSAFFSTEISSLESQVAALQAQIAQAQARVAALSECEADADGMLQVVQKTLGKVSALAPDAIATLKSAVFALFNSGEGDSDGNQPISPAPQPNLNGQTCGIDPDAYWDSAAPDGSSWELATPLCCEVSDAPLRGQFTELTCAMKSNVVPVYEEIKPAISTAVAESENLFNLVRLNNLVAYMRRGCDGEIVCCYVGANNKQNLKRWGEFLTVSHSVGTRFEVREAKRLTNWKWELKLWGLSFQQIEKLSNCDISKDPRKALPDAPRSKTERVPSMLEIENIGVGDLVRSITVKNWQWKVEKINADGLLECDRVGANPPIKQTLHPGSVELISKADVDAAVQELSAYIEQQAQSIAPVIDPEDVPRGVILRQTSDDFIVEFNVFAWVIVRNQGVPEPQQRQIGRLVEGLGKIESYRPKAGIYHAFTRTLDAVNYLISGSGYSQSNIDAGIELFESRQKKVLVGVGSSAQQLEDVEF